MAYVDGFLLVLPKKNLAAYKKMAQKAGKIWKEHGAVEYVETVGDDVNPSFGIPFPKVANAKKNELVVFSWVVYKNKAHRDKVNKKIMSDPRMAEMMPDPKKCPFDMKRMSYGGFKPIVQM